ncbi:MAG: hypothetical protein ACRDRV_15080 [Pseudonocardiaceae bacterium]
MTHWYSAVLGALVAGVLLLLAVEVGTRTSRRSSRTHRGKPMFQMQRNGRVRFELEDLRRSAVTATRHLPRPGPYGAVPDLENTLPDLFSHQVVPLPRPHDWVD